MWSGVLSIVFEHHHPSELKLFQIDIPFHMRVFMELVSPASWLYNTLVLLCSEYGNRYAEGLSGEGYHSQWLLDRILRLSSTPYLILGVQRFQKNMKPFRFVWHDWSLKDFLTCELGKRLCYEKISHELLRNMLCIDGKLLSYLSPLDIELWVLWLAWVLKGAGNVR